MQHCVEIAEDFQSGQGTQELIYIFRPGFESAKKVSETEQSGIDELHSSRYSEIYTTE
jgi:hypothetical protein